MTIYIDDEYKCYSFNDGDKKPIETSYFDGKCVEFIEGYRYVPAGEVWVRGDGVPFQGLMIAPWKPYSQLYEAQLEYEVEQYKIAMTEIEIALGQEV